MYSIQQLRGELTSISDQPSGILMVYFKVCVLAQKKNTNYLLN